MENKAMDMGVYQVLSDVRMPECSLRTLQLSSDGAVNPHVHHMTTQVYFIVEGDATVIIGDERKKLGPLQSLRIPVGTAHAIITESTATVLSISIPPLRAGDQSTR